MANDSKKVTTGKGNGEGYAFIAASGTALPTDATTALADAYECLGFISEDGITNATERESESIRDMNGIDVLNIQTGFSETWQASYIESLNVNVLKMIYGDSNVTETDGAISIVSNGAELESHVFVYDLIAQGNRKIRNVIPYGKVTEVGEVVYKAGEAVAFDVTIAALPDESGNCRYQYIAAE